MTRLSLAIATVCGVGYAPIAPGTFGSLVGLLMWAVLRHGSTGVQAAAIAVLLVGGSLAGSV
ncbi:MAG: phosphatidylglycerophosphatase A, partial [Acidobacteriota bacterium]